MTTGLKPAQKLRTMLGLEQRIAREQYDLIKAKYSERDANLAIYGVGVDCQEQSIRVETKVYGYPERLISTGILNAGIAHCWE